MHIKSMAMNQRKSQGGWVNLQLFGLKSLWIWESLLQIAYLFYIERSLLHYAHQIAIKQLDTDHNVSSFCVSLYNFSCWKAWLKWSLLNFSLHFKIANKSLSTQYQKCITRGNYVDSLISSLQNRTVPVLSFGASTTAAAWWKYSTILNQILSHFHPLGNKVLDKHCKIMESPFVVKRCYMIVRQICCHSEMSYDLLLMRMKTFSIKWIQHVEDFYAYLWTEQHCPQ